MLNLPDAATTTPCADAFDRPRRITVGRHGDHVVIIVPPGESATLTPAAAGQFLADLMRTYHEVIGQSEVTDRNCVLAPRVASR